MNKKELLKLTKKALTLIGQKESAQKVMEIVKKDETTINAFVSGAWTLLNEKYVRINNGLDTYLKLKIDVFSELSGLDENKLTKKQKANAAKVFVPADKEYINEIKEKIDEYYALLQEFKNFDEVILTNMDVIAKNEIERKSKSAHENVVYHLEEVEHLEPLAKNFVYRASMEDSIEL